MDRFLHKWIDFYINGLKDNIKLFGSTINALGKKNNPDAHVQSYIFSMDKNTLEYLIKYKIFTTEYYTKDIWETINDREIKMSALILKNGWNIGSLLKYYDGIDFTSTNNREIFYFYDLMQQHYKDHMWNLYELVFVKGKQITI